VFGHIWTRHNIIPIRKPNLKKISVSQSAYVKGVTSCIHICIPIRITSITHMVQYLERCLGPHETGKINTLLHSYHSYAAIIILPCSLTIAYKAERACTMSTHNTFQINISHKHAHRCRRVTARLHTWNWSKMAAVQVLTLLQENSLLFLETPSKTHDGVVVEIPCRMTRSFQRGVGRRGRVPLREFWEHHQKNSPKHCASLQFPSRTPNNSVRWSKRTPCDRV